MTLAPRLRIIGHTQRRAEDGPAPWPGAIRARAGRGFAGECLQRIMRGFLSARLGGEAGCSRVAGPRGVGRDAARSGKAATADPGEPRQGDITFVGAGPGAADLLTLRAVRHLQKADVIFYDRLVDPSVLELAGRDAERVFVGKHVGAHDWPQERICEVIVAAARQGRRVVRLKSGDPGIFGRLAEELAAARAAGIATEIVPGITAAHAAAAGMGRALTARGETDTLIVTTGMNRAGGNAPDCLRFAAPGTTVAIYMGVAEAGNIAAGLVARGLPATSEVLIAHAVSTARERYISCPLNALAATLARESISGVTTLIVTWPRALAPARSLAGAEPPAAALTGELRHDGQAAT